MSKEFTFTRTAQNLILESQGYIRIETVKSFMTEKEKNPNPFKVNLREGVDTLIIYYLKIYKRTISYSS